MLGVLKGVDRWITANLKNSEVEVKIKIEELILKTLKWRRPTKVAKQENLLHFPQISHFISFFSKAGITSIFSLVFSVDGKKIRPAPPVENLPHFPTLFPCSVFLPHLLCRRKKIGAASEDYYTPI